MIFNISLIDTPSITPEQIKKAENIVNELIRDGKNVTVKVYTKDTPEEQLKEVRKLLNKLITENFLKTHEMCIW